MTLDIRVSALIFATAIAGCAATPEVQTAEVKPAAKDCTMVTGSNLCRKSDSGNPNALYSISGDDLRKSGGPITGAQPGRTGD
jgi:hypothetical protein